ncbi:MAG: disulfide bond formation protein B [Thiogranum sp.]|nr:disulfide bond formation protein B [Thiogranum sp.]
MPRNALLPSYRLLNIFGFLTTVFAMLFGILYLERTLYLEPCPLCMIDRVFFTGIGMVFLLAALHDPGRVGQRIYATLNGLLALGGIATAARHVWLQHLPADQVPECGASLAYMMETLPLVDTLKNVLQGSGECAESQWSLLGLSIAEQTLLLFIFLFAVALVQLLRRGAMRQSR